MAQRIILKHGTGSQAPAALKQGELGINVSSGSLYYGSGSTNVTKSSFCFSEITASNKIKGYYGSHTGTGNITASGTITAGKLNSSLAAGTTNTAVIMADDGTLQKRSIDSGVWGQAGAVLTAESDLICELTVGSANTCTTATTAQTVQAVSTTDNADFFVTVVDGASAGQTVETSANLKYNPSTKGLTVGGSGSFTSVTSSGTIESMNVTASNASFTKYSGTKHLLYSGVVYVNANPLTQNAVYMGNNFSNQDSNWNTAQAAGGALGSTSTITITEDNFRWGLILPFDVSAVELQCSMRPGGACTGDNFFLGLYGANRPNNDASANLDITLLAHQDTTFVQGKFVTNDFTHTANLSKGYMIFIGVGSEDSTAAKNAPVLLNCIITQR